ncbi:MAG TPA: ribonuclease P protein component [Thermomicrobiales bacterium]|jgi:ribonuclease P protein component
MERRLRLRGEAEVRAARAQGKAFADGPLVARVLPNALEPPQNRYAVVAGKRVGKAVERNRAKRLVREALRRLHPGMSQGYDVVVIVRGTADELPGFATALACLERIAKRARLVDEASGVRRQASGATGDGGRDGVQTAEGDRGVRRTEAEG